MAQRVLLMKNAPVMFVKAEAAARVIMNPVTQAHIVAGIKAALIISVRNDKS